MNHSRWLRSHSLSRSPCRINIAEHFLSRSLARQIYRKQSAYGEPSLYEICLLNEQALARPARRMNERMNNTFRTRHEHTRFSLSIASSDGEEDVVLESFESELLADDIRLWLKRNSNQTGRENFTSACRLCWKIETKLSTFGD